MGIINFFNRFGISVTDDILLSFASVLLPFLTVVFGYKFFILMLTKFDLGYQPIRSDGPASHVAKKKKVFTLGGLLIFIAMFVSSMIIYDKLSPLLVGLILIYASNMLLGGIDDYLKLTKKDTRGVSGKQKLLFQFITTIGILYGLMSFYPEDMTTMLMIPLFENEVDLGYAYYLFAAIVIVGSSNAVNLTDGLDGLAAYTLLPVLVFFMVIISLSDNSYMMIFGGEFLDDLKNSVYMLYITFGAILGFLWWNSHPAKIFMGDVGSLPLGSLIGFFAVVTKSELLFVILAGIFVVESLSVILQVYYYKMTKKRIFKMAPIHHHYELTGIKENVLVARFFSISVILCLLSLTLVFI
ncbi:MAG: phospho-N-acetylmuramoyl-pentapeptide-transferase [Rickettsiales bacterium]|jgi:phospho-N-acetylmuramoyl-pentapeptide-transferase|nr:phospho-N-acetylmuramoyl-pentapeptide-transferase [Rickettsiales bacterium]